MPKVERNDTPGAWHHVMNRGIARRTVFETREDVRYFLSRLARAVHEGLVEVHAYVVLTTHFHLLLRSPRGEVSRAMMLAENAYVRWFNRRRRRDGPLFRGRFRSKLIEEGDYWRTVVRYIDQNAVAARLAHDSVAYPYGSAFHYARGSGPPWLTRSRVEASILDSLKKAALQTGDYSEVFGARLPAEECELIERRLQQRPSHRDELADLVASAPEKVRRWMLRKAYLADGTRPGVPVAAPQVLSKLIRARARVDGDWMVRPSRKSRSGWPLLEVGLLRFLAGLEIRTIATRIGVSEKTVSRMLAAHNWLVREDEEYAERAGDVASSALRSRAPSKEGGSARSR